MPNNFFRFKQFIIYQDKATMKVTTDACLFGAWVADQILSSRFHPPAYCLDIGAGTGLLTLMVAQKMTGLMDAIEIQKPDYEQCAQNFQTSKWATRINAIYGDIFTYSFDKKYDILISNPPFYENDLKGPSPLKNVAHHDSTLTLKRLVLRLPSLMKKEAQCFLLLPAKREAELLTLLKNADMYLNRIVRVHQTNRHSAFRIIAECSFKNIPMIEKSLTIKIDGTYSNDFTGLLREYYL